MTNLVYGRHKFLSRRLPEGENVQQLVREAKNCKLKELEESLIRRTMICGLISNDLR